MSAQKLITDHLDLWTGAIASKSTSGRGSSGKIDLVGIKKLRELVLDLATRGKLTPQDPNDEPAIKIVEKIDETRKKLLKAGSIKKVSKLPPIPQEEIPFAAPTGWLWIRLGELTEKIGSGATPRGGKNAYVESGIPFLRSQNIWNDGIHLHDVAYINPKTHERMSNTHVLPKDILLNITGASLGRCTVVPASLDAANVSQHVTIIRAVEPIDRQYLHYLMLSPYAQSLIWGRQVGMAREGLSKKVLEQFEIPLAPLAEQHRIVQKVDELMALCDRLEQQTSNQLEAHETLVDTLLGTLTQSENATDLADNWARLATHFDTLFTTEQSIDKLKQTILQLAVMGRLVEQDAGDEPASDLLRSIKDEKAKLIRDKKLKRQEELPEAGEEEKPFRLPVSWLWARLGDYSADIHYGYTASANESLSDFRLLRITDIQDDKVAWETVPGCEITKAQANQYLLSDGDILIARTGGTIGKSYLVENIDVNAVFASYLIRVRKLSSTYSKYVKIFLGSQMYWNQLYKASMGTGQPNVNGKALKNLLLPVPPLSEQFRIVRRVEDLLKICDELKERLNQASETRCQLADAIVEGALH